MKKIIIVLLCLIGVKGSAFSQNNTTSIVLEIRNVTVNGGMLYVSICTSEETYKKQQPAMSYEFVSTSAIIRQEINVPVGECVILIYQDTNNNGKSDTGFLGIPKEPVGITNWDGNGPPGNYKKLKIAINDMTEIVVVNLYQL
ncbi:MAG: DUF2141 domain-containing protein [Treponema sp.]|jgi:uncharacterized protein (DUF2141 family)|nr:DUF2141 domain-containing protein [Treponema sp.]